MSKFPTRIFLPELIAQASMGLASVVPHGGAICIALNSDLRVSSVSTTVQSPRWTGVRFSNPRLSVIHSVSHNRQAICFPVARSRGMEEEDQLSEDEQNSYANSKEKLQENKAYVSSAKSVAFWVCSAVAFGVGVGLKEGVGKASEFFAGYLLEQSLSVDNLFVFILIFKYFKVPHMYQNRVLSYGIAGAIIFRLSLILLGTATLQRFEVVNLLLAAILLFSSFKLFSSEEDDTDLSDNFIVKTCQRFIPVTPNYDGNKFITKWDNIWQATPLLLTVAVIELSDIAFAVDSIPAVFGVTRDPFIVFSSNIFAILGLRSLYTLIAEGMADLEYLQPSIAVVLGFIGCKMILDFFGFHISTEASLGFVATSLSAGVLLSLAKKGD
ncbi:thylakoid membrane protein TERC, chloroplastic-like [Hibiscus syriacus]|uniref:thylakoid membrane protein TERC, chloroplastic-like n=1 Tax=Hibiscus syriacus TaxID=106335 RepID=UPI001920AD49|nr:thylakoid membrane protein TERC, chloroplastic-like [Hibiscus syriacus]